MYRQMRQAFVADVKAKEKVQKDKIGDAKKQKKATSKVLIQLSIGGLFLGRLA